MAARIAYVNAEGNVAVVSPAPEARLEDESDAAFVARILAKDVPPSMQAAAIIVDHVALPTRQFRGDWVISGNTVAVDIVKARQRVVANAVDEANKRVAASDSLVVKAIDSGTPANQAAVKSYRAQTLAVPNVVQGQVAAMNLAQLVAFSPTWPAAPVF